MLRVQTANFFDMEAELDSDAEDDPDENDSEGSLHQSDVEFMDDEVADEEYFFVDPIELKRQKKVRKEMRKLDRKRNKAEKEKKLRAQIRKEELAKIVNEKKRRQARTVDSDSSEDEYAGSGGGGGGGTRSKPSAGKRRRADAATRSKPSSPASASRRGQPAPKRRRLSADQKIARSSPHSLASGAATSGSQTRGSGFARAKPVTNSTKSNLSSSAMAAKTLLPEKNRAPFRDVWKAAFANIRAGMASKVLKMLEIKKGLHLLETCGRPSKPDLEQAIKLLFAIKKWREGGKLDQLHRLRMHNLYKYGVGTPACPVAVVGDAIVAFAACCCCWW
jgi:hypothetical protein